jgi:DNA-binding XRE family transcriptional regulator
MTDEKIAELYKEIGARIRSYRRKIAMKPEILAEHLGLTRASIVNIEKGRHKPAIHTLLEISEVLQIPYVDLIPSIHEVKKVRAMGKVISNQAAIDPESFFKQFLTLMDKPYTKKSL